jgi:hypothetical protein
MEQEDLGRKEGFRAIDGMKGSELYETVLLVGWKGLPLVGRKGPGAGKEIVADRRGKSGSIWTDLEAL